MKTELEQLKEQLNSISEKIKQLETPSLQKGKWYKRNKELLVWNDYKKTYGFTEDGMWSNDMLFSRDLNICVPATDKEVEEALIKEAKKRGFKEGVKFYSTYHDKNWGHGEVGKISFGINWSSGLNTVLFSGNHYIFTDGKWAEIVSEPLKIGGYEVKKEREDTYSIGCKTITGIELRQIKSFMSSNKFDTVEFNSYGKITMNQINKILDL
jgi:hypothetical protein